MDVSHSSSVNQRLRQARIQHNWRQREVADRIGTTVLSVKRWEQGKQPSAYFRERLCILFGKSAQELGLVERNPPPTTTEKEASISEKTSPSPGEGCILWTVPYPRNLHFAGRDAVLEQLAQHLSLQEAGDPTTTRQAALTQARAIKGLGGIGKTQIAVEYAYRAQEQGRYAHILWVNATNEEAIMTSLVTLAELIPAFPAKEETNQRKLVAAIKRWLEQCQQRWLLILDNADDVALLQEYLPQRGNGSLLFTTRADAVGSFATSIEVENMGLMEGTLFLLHRAQRQHARDEERNEAANVVIALDGFPLALDQAGAYIEETRCSFKDYLQLYQDHRKTLLARRGTQATNYPDSVATTWSLSFQKVERANPAAAELLRLCAFLAPDHIPEELLKDGAPYWPPLLQKAAADFFTFNQMLEELLTFSLIKRLIEDHMLSIHRLVQVVQMDTMEPEEQRQWAERVVYAVHAVFPRNPKEEVATWPQCLRYLEQAQTCAALIQQHLLRLSEAADVLERTGTYLRERALYTLAESLYQRALQIREQQLGAEHLDVAHVLNHLAILYYEQSNYELAEPLYQRALQIRERHLGPEHPDVTYALNGLGLLYYNQGKYEQAEPLYQRTRQIREQSLGPEHPLVAQPLNNLAILYYEQGKYEQAEPLYQRALWILEQHLGLEHPDIAAPLNGLARLYYDQGKYEQAEPLYQRALRIREQHLGPEHPKLTYSLTGLAFLYQEQGKYEQAELLYQRTLWILEQHSIPEYPLRLYPLDGLAGLYARQGKYEQAEQLYQRVLRILEQHLGPEHPDMVSSLTGLAELYQKQGKYADAEPLYQRALSMRLQVFGPLHPKTTETRERLRAVLMTLGQREAVARLDGMQSERAKKGEE